MHLYLFLYSVCIKNDVTQKVSWNGFIFSAGICISSIHKVQLVPQPSCLEVMNINVSFLQSWEVSRAVGVCSALCFNVLCRACFQALFCSLLKMVAWTAV